MLNPIENRTVLFERNVAFAGFLLHSLTQLAHIWCPWPECRQRLFSIFFTAFVFLFPALMPRQYLQHRNTFLICFKLVYFSFPLLRKPRGIQRVLDSPATAGLSGFFLDLIKTAWGKLYAFDRQMHCFEISIVLLNNYCFTCRQ